MCKDCDLPKKQRVLRMITRQFRHGKTRRDRANGYPQRRREHQQARLDWQEESKFNFLPPWPAQATNGKRNRFRFTGRSGRTIILHKAKNAEA